MARAGRAVAWTLRQVLGSCRGRRVVIVCGKGNNGGDGLVTARALRAWGARVAVFELADGVDRATFTREIGRADAVVDAMYGTGFTGELRDDAAFVAGVFDAFTGPVVAVDIPSGIDGLTGEVTWRCRACQAHRSPSRRASPDSCSNRGTRTRARSASPRSASTSATPPRIAVVLAADDVRELPRAPPAAHKWQAGVYVVGGSGGMTGAPMFVSHAAMRAGAGIVWCGLPGDDAARAAAGQRGHHQGAARDRRRHAHHDRCRRRARRRRSVPGAGRRPGPRHLPRAPPRRAADRRRAPGAARARRRRAQRPRRPPRRPAVPQAPTVVTPHEGEYRRLTGHDVGPDRLAAARGWPRPAARCVLLKGPGTVIADPRGPSS